MGSGISGQIEIIGNIKFSLAEKKPGDRPWRLTGRKRTTKDSDVPAYEVEFFSPFPGNMILARFYARCGKDEMGEAFSKLLYSRPDDFSQLLLPETPSLLTLRELLEGFYDDDGRYVKLKEMRNEHFLKLDLPVKRNHMNLIISHFGDISVSDLEDKAMQKKFYDTIKSSSPDKGIYSEKSMANIISELSVALSDAVERKRIFTNPAESLRIFIGNEPTRKTVAFTIEELFRIFSATDAWNSKYIAYAATLFAFQTGMRIGEVLALRPCDVSVENSLVRINSNLKRTGEIGQTKTFSKRAAPLTDLAGEVIKPLTGDGRKYIFSIDGITPITYQGVYRAFMRVLEKLEIQAENGNPDDGTVMVKAVHSLRFSWVTLNSRSGDIPQDIISFICGHDSETVTATKMNRHYTSLTSDVLNPVRIKTESIFTDDMKKEIRQTMKSVENSFFCRKHLDEKGSE